MIWKQFGCLFWHSSVAWQALPNRNSRPLEPSGIIVCQMKGAILFIHLKGMFLVEILLSVEKHVE